MKQIPNRYVSQWEMHPHSSSPEDNLSKRLWTEMEASMTFTMTDHKDKLKTNTTSKPKGSSGKCTVTTTYQEPHPWDRGYLVQDAATERSRYFLGAPEQKARRTTILTSPTILLSKLNRKPDSKGAQMMEVSLTQHNQNKHQRRMNLQRQKNN